MRFDWTITFSAILQVAGFVAVAVAAYYAISARMRVFETSLRTHAETLTAHAIWQTHTDAKILEIVADLSKLIGRSEVFFRAKGGVRGDA